jgi:hypothetical protein
MALDGGDVFALADAAGMSIGPVVWRLQDNRARCGEMPKVVPVEAIFPFYGKIFFYFDWSFVKY